jgi:MraZ protein
MLIGEYKHTLDEKNRISIPSKFRTVLGKKIVITKGLDNCLSMYSLKDWSKIAAQLGELSFTQSDARNFNRFLLASAHEVAIDSVGRVLIPDTLCEFAKIKTKVVFAGMYNRVEIWDETAWTTFNEQVSKNADAIAEKLGQIGAI